MKFKHLLLLITLFISSATQAQLFQDQLEKEDLIARLPFAKKMRVAEGLYKVNSYDNAAKYFSQLKKEQPRNPYLALMLAECARKNRDYPPAAHYFNEAYNLAPALYPMAPYHEADMLKSCGKYQEAIDRIDFFLTSTKIKDKKIKAMATRLKDGAKMALQSIQTPEPVYVKNAGPNVNTVATEGSPMPLGDTALLFSTMNINQIIDVDKIRRAEYVSRLMWSPKEYDRTKIKDTFEVSMPFTDGRFNNNKFDISNGSWSPGRERFYFSQCKVEDSGKVICKVWVAKWDTSRGIWGIPDQRGLEFVNDVDGSISSDNTNPMVCMVGKKEVLFFSSNRKGQSAGGYDIWYSVYDPKQKTYRRPQNCGKKINTNRDEKTPWYDSKKNTLYFASNGIQNVGGFDIFAAVGGPTRYSSVKNIGFPYNSPADDFGYIEDMNAKGNAYIVSNRLGTTYIKNPTCCDDIFRVIKTPDLAVRGNVYDEATNELLGKVVIKMSDDADNKVLDTFMSASGNYRFNATMGKNYTISADKEGYTSSSAAYSTASITAIDPDVEGVVDIYMRKIVKGDEVLTVSNVFYDFDRGQFQPKSYVALDSLAGFMSNNPSISVEVYSNTDGKGDDKYNDELSVLRAQEVINYLSGKGIDKARMTARPQGKRVKAMAEGGSNDADSRAMNRRTYFRIIGDVPGKRIQYDDNRPEYIDKSTKSRRDANLDVKENDEADQGVIPAEAQPR
jgi:OmpA-OmpF porin, OOP family